MTSKPSIIHPIARIIIFFVMFTGIFMASLNMQLLGYGILLLLLCFSGQIQFHVKICVISGFPFLLVLLLVYGYLINDDTLGIIYALSIFIKIMSLTALFQFTFALVAVELIDLLKYSGLNDYLKLIILESYSSTKDLTVKVNQILTARLSRGYMKKRTLWQQFIQFPFLLRPMISGLLNGSFEKSVNWKQLRLMSQFKTWIGSKKLIHNYSKLQSYLTVIVVLFWFVFILISKYIY